MKQRTDESQPDQLPDPELNPMQNPLLAEHMGRWAEVYFTTPPEKRAQAIAELLRELRAAASTGALSVQEVRVNEQRFDDKEEQRLEEKEKKNEVPPLPDRSHAGVEHSLEAPVACGACGRNNPAGLLFCAICGGRLPAGDFTPLPGLRPVESAVSFRTSLQEYVKASSTSGSREDRDETDGDWPLAEGGFSSFDVEAESDSVPHHYRFYAGVVLVVLLLIWVYMAWRGERNSGASPQPAPLAATPGAPPAVSPSPQASSATPDNSVRSDSPVSMEASSPKEPNRLSQHGPAAHAQDPSTLPSPYASPHSTLAEQGGAQELAAARKFLDGGAGGDGAAAGSLLWKAIGKGNVAAMMILSDLYLRGDGVPKNCDQARLLLDAAARKGVAEAAQRLRNLQAFGCQ